MLTATLQIDIKLILLIESKIKKCEQRLNINDRIIFSKV